MGITTVPPHSHGGGVATERPALVRLAVAVLEISAAERCHRVRGPVRPRLYLMVCPIGMNLRCLPTILHLLSVCTWTFNNWAVSRGVMSWSSGATTGGAVG